MSGKRLALVSQPQGFFHELISAAMGHQRVSARAETQFYLVNLLNQFMLAENLYARDKNGNALEEPLAIMLKDALEQPSPEQQLTLLRRIGDVSLYTAGFFQDSLSRKLVDVDYYIGMGNNAYNQAAIRADEAILQVTYKELAEKFARFVEVFAEVSEKTSQKSEKDILRIYDLWVKTRSKRAEKQLKKAGIIPNKTVKKNQQ